MLYLFFRMMVVVQVLFQEVLTIVIPVGGAHGGVNVLAGRSAAAT